MNDSLAEIAPTLQSSLAGDKLVLSGTHQQILGKLEHLGRYSPVVQILTGPQGGGKSTLLQQLATSFPYQEAISISVAANYDTDEAELLTAISEGLGVDIPTGIDNSNQLALIIRELKILQASQRFLFLLVDNGESIGKSALNLLLKTFQELDESIRPHLFIAGQPVFADKIKNSPYAASIPENLCHYVELPALDFAESTVFIQHNFPEEAELLNESRLAHVHQRSLGLPGQIEKALHQEISHPTTSKQQLPIGKLIGTSLLTVGLIAISGVASYMLWSLYTQPAVDGEQISVTLPAPIQQPQAPAQPTVIPAPVSQPNLTDTTTAESSATISAPLQTSPLANNDVAIAEKESRDADNNNPDNLNVAKAINLPDDSKDEPPVLTTPANNKLVLRLKPAAPKQPVEASPSADSTPTKAQTETASNQGLNTAKQVKQVKPMIIRPANPLLREDELLSWNSNGYTLQMLGARKESSVIGFIQSRSNRSDFYYFSTIYKEKPWYVVVYGQYPSRDDAIKAIRSLPSDLKQRKPWARSINGVQDDIRRK